MSINKDRICGVEGCEKAAPARLVCEMHYSRMRTRGTYDPPPPRPRSGACRADGCDQLGDRSQGYCGKHWERVKRHGSPDVGVIIWNDPERRFWSHVEKTEGCWLWTGSLTYDGYTVFRVGERRTGAHRWAWEFVNGPIPAGKQLDHLCRVRHCVRPDHLEVVTPAENTRRAVAARRRA